MKRLAIAILTISLLSVSATWKPKRVSFPPGRTTVILKGTTTGGPSESGGMDPVAYVLKARKGQTMIHLTSAKKNAVFGLYAPGTELVEGAQTVADWTGELPKTGDYEIIVFPEDEQTNTTFTLEITIR